MVLVVLSDASARASMADVLAADGYEILTAGSFRDGRTLLLDRHPDVLVTGLRLQDHNGIHLAIVSRLRSAPTKTIVLGYGDPVLAAEAGQAGALYLTDATPDDVRAAVSGVIQRTERKWPRGRANLNALAADRPVRLVDLSYGGFRMELQPDAPVATGRGFDLTVGGIKIAAQPVWTRHDQATERLWCGAAVLGEGDANPAWRELVDDVLGHEAAQ